MIKGDNAEILLINLDKDYRNYNLTHTLNTLDESYLPNNVELEIYSSRANGNGDFVFNSVSTGYYLMIIRSKNTSGQYSNMLNHADVPHGLGTTFRSEDLDKIYEVISDKRNRIKVETFHLQRGKTYEFNYHFGANVED